MEKFEIVDISNGSQVFKRGYKQTQKSQAIKEIKNFVEENFLINLDKDCFTFENVYGDAENYVISCEITDNMGC